MLNLLPPPPLQISNFRLKKQQISYRILGNATYNYNKNTKTQTDLYNLPENKTRRFGYISSYDKREKTRKEVSSHLGLVEYHFVDAQFFTVDLEFKCCTSLVADFYK